MKATFIVAFLPNSAAEQEDAGERDALSSLNPTQPHSSWYMMGYHDGQYQKQIGYRHSQAA